MFHFSLYFALFATMVSATSRCEIVERGVQGFEAKFYTYEWKDNAGWNAGFFENGGYNKGEVLHTASGVTQINFGVCADRDDIRYGHIYGQETTISNYTIELTGYFTPTSTGNHIFYVQAENGASLKISRGLSCCNSPNGGAYGDYELQMLDNGHWEGDEKKGTFFLEDGVRYFITIVTFNWQGSGGLKVRFMTPNNEQADEMGAMVFQDKYNTEPCPDSSSSLPKSFETINENQETECSSRTQTSTAPNDSESTSTKSTATSSHDAEVPPVAATIVAPSTSSGTTDACIQCSSTESMIPAPETSEATSTPEPSSTQSNEPEASSACESCSSTTSREPILDSRPADVIFEKASEESTTDVSSKCIDIELALLEIFSTSKEGTTSLEHSDNAGQNTHVSLSSDKISQESMETISQGKEKPKETPGTTNEMTTAPDTTQRTSEPEPSSGPVSAGISLGSVDKSVDTSVVQTIPQLKVSGAVSASATLSGKDSTKTLSEVAGSSSKTTQIASTKSRTSSQVNSSQPGAATSSRQNVNLTTASADNDTITSCTKDCKVETSTTYVTMTTTNERGTTVTVTYCPRTEQAQPSDICIAGDLVCLSYAASVNVYSAPVLVTSSKVAKPKPSAAVSETKENQAMETATKSEETASSCTDCNVETSTTYVTMTTTNERGTTVTVTYCPRTEQAQPSDICIAGDSVCLSYAASVNVYSAPALVTSSKVAKPRPSAAVSETKENQAMETTTKSEETATSCTDCKVETSTTYVTMTTTNERGMTVTVTYCPRTEQAQPSDICIAGDLVCLSYAASVNVYSAPALVTSSRVVKSKPSATVSETKENQVMETTTKSEETATSCTDCNVETNTTYVTMTTTNERGTTVTVTYCPRTEQAQPSDICIAGDLVCLSYAASVNVYSAPALVTSSKVAKPKPSATVSETKENEAMETATKSEESNVPPRSRSTAINSQPAQSVKTDSPAKVASSGNSKETTSAKDTSRHTPEDIVNVTVTSTTRGEARPKSPVSETNSAENGASPIGAGESFKILASLAVALISLLILA